MIFVDDTRQLAAQSEEAAAPAPHGVFKQIQPPAVPKTSAGAFASQPQSGGRIATLTSLSERRFFFDNSRSISMSEIMSDPAKKVLTHVYLYSLS